MATNRSMPPSIVIPELHYPDVRDAVDWLCRSFGFVERLRIADHRAQLILGEGSIIVIKRDGNPGAYSLMVRVDDVDSHYAHAAQSGTRIVSPPKDYPYGERQYTAEDLGGHRWTFSQTVADVDPAMWGGILLTQQNFTGKVFMNKLDLQHLRTAINVAQHAREHGNHPFGAILVDENNQVLLQTENTVVTERDCTGHAETNLMRLASQNFPPEKLALCTLYTSTEPCAMCAGAIHWGNVRRVVYGLSEVALYEIIGPSPDHLFLPCHEVFARSQRHVEVIGPAMELDAEARAVHEGFW